MKRDWNPQMDRNWTLSTAPWAAPHSTESSTRNSGPIGDHQQIDDQYRPMTLGEEEILRLYEEGIYQAQDMMQLLGGLWITGDPWKSCSLQTAPIPIPIPDTVEMEDLDSELEELLRDSLEIWTPPTQPTPPDYPHLPGVVWTAEQLVYAAGRDMERLRDALQEIL